MLKCKYALIDFTRLAALAFSAVVLTSPAAFGLYAQDAPSEEPVAQNENQDAPPSLDDLLGLEEDETDREDETVAEREAREELDRRLREKTIHDTFQLAIEKMTISADQLDQQFDAGLGTQRIQEEIIQRLSHLIDEARRQQSNSSSSSSSSASSSQSQSQSQPGPQTQSNQQQNGERNAGPSSGSRENEPPPMQEGDINSVIDESRTEWGSLPPRVRDQLLQGSRDKFSSLYERLTQEYYRRLAEENAP